MTQNSLPRFVLLGTLARDDRRARVRGGAAAPRVCWRSARSGPSKQVVVADAVVPVH